MKQDFSEVVDVGATPAAAWSTVEDIANVLSWISIVDDVATIEPGSRYTAVLQDKLGPFKLHADLGIDVHADETLQRIVARAEGEDRQIGSRLTVDVRLEITEHDGAATVSISGAYEVTGRPASLGAGSIRKKANKVLNEFFTRLGAELESPVGQV
jgi:carbon monoxide dehydrogenase subunit G